MRDRKALGESNRWIVKVGSSLVTDEGRGLNLSAMASWAEQIVKLRIAGKQVVMVSSGAVAAGMASLGWTSRPRELNNLQAAAAVGQMRLIQAYEEIFSRHQLHAAQVLLTYSDLADRQRYLNARSTLRTLLDLGVIPIINENDTVSTEELRFGDNDTLASLVANLVEADLMVILTDQQGLFDKDPRHSPDAKLISQAQAEDKSLRAMATPAAGAVGRGGMLAKVTAAERAARSGAATIIAAGREPEILSYIASGAPVGTLLTTGQEPMVARKQWIAGHLRVKGNLFVDDGAVQVLRQLGKSLLPVGIKSVEGKFQRGDVVACHAPGGDEIARGLVNYSAEECRKIIGAKSSQIESLLGYVDEFEVIHRDNLVLL